MTIWRNREKSNKGVNEVYGICNANVYPISLKQVLSPDEKKFNGNGFQK